MAVRLKNRRGQQIGEYAVMVGIVATAFLGMQMYVTRRLGAGLVSASHFFIGNAAPDANDRSASNSFDTVEEHGGPAGVRTTTHSEGDGESHSGFILAEAYGPYIVKSTTFADRPSLNMIVSTILAEYGDNASISTLAYDSTNDDLTITVKDDRGTTQRITRKLGNYRVVEGSIKTDGTVITAMLDMDGNFSTTDDRRMVMAVPKDIAMTGGLVDAVMLQDVQARRAWFGLQGFDLEAADNEDLAAMVSPEDKDKIAAGKQAAVHMRRTILAALEKKGLKPGSAADMEQMLTALSPDELQGLMRSLRTDADTIDTARETVGRINRDFTQKGLDMVVPWSPSHGEALLADNTKEPVKGDPNEFAAAFGEATTDIGASKSAAERIIAYLDAAEQGGGTSPHSADIRARAQHVIDMANAGNYGPGVTTGDMADAYEVARTSAKEVDTAYDELRGDLGLNDDGSAGKKPTPQEIAQSERAAQGQAGELMASIGSAAPVEYQNPDGSLQPDAVGKIVAGAQDRAKIVGELQAIVKQFDGDGAISLTHFSDIKSHTEAAAAALQRQDLGALDREIAAAKDLLRGDLNEFFDVGRETTPASHDGHASLATLQRWEDRARKGSMLSGSSGTQGGVLIDRDGDQLPDVVRTGKDHGVVDGRYQTDEQYASLEWMVAEPGDVANVTTEGRDAFGAALVLQIQAQDPALARQSGNPSATVKPMENDGFTVEESLATGRAPVHYQHAEAFKRLSPGSVPAGATSIMDLGANQKGASQRRTTTPPPEPEKPGGPPKGKYN